MGLEAQEVSEEEWLGECGEYEWVQGREGAGGRGGRGGRQGKGQRPGQGRGQQRCEGSSEMGLPVTVSECTTASVSL